MTMNIFRLTGDLMHLASIVILILKIRKTKSASGISWKTQLLYLVVFLSRYLDLFAGHFISLYLVVMKLLYIGTSAYILFLMKQLHFTWDAGKDRFPVQYLLIGSAICAILFHEEFSVLEMFWSFSIWLESVAILPQLYVVQMTGECETITSHYLFALGAYRALYIPNWIYKWAMGEHVHWISVLAGVIQTALYSDFFWIYYQK
eukprot:NODE_111_length_18624_cov_1.285020.p10 type:complete len:204 gc:universal NODE_111_length_18624_cov_1.285020:6404-7015(+)